MHVVLLQAIVKRCLNRQRQGDYPTDPPFAQEMLEDAVIDLSSVLAQLARAAESFMQNVRTHENGPPKLEEARSELKAAIAHANRVLP